MKYTISNASRAMPARSKSDMSFSFLALLYSLRKQGVFVLTGFRKIPWRVGANQHRLRGLEGLITSVNDALIFFWLR
ncbi:hypothetical protein [Sinorhizobium fredii]|uniref:hypothetical protein n=1 Tax=Rhizobium fredii TaxID=380 RepID=UPI0012FD34EA|nr:hypothetical protein [Sinorhizobium fredii]